VSVTRTGGKLESIGETGAASLTVPRKDLHGFRDDRDGDGEVAVVGDAIFAGSMGGGLVSYADAIHNNRDKILSLPDDTILCPGHGPLTSVGEEKLHNPFFPDLQKN